MRTDPILGALVLLGFSSCLREELPVPARERGAAMTMQTCMGPGYQDQLWLDLRTGTVVNTNVKTVWDLAFESAPDGWRIYLNGSKMMTAWNIGPADITAAHDTLGMAAGRKIDAPSGHRDSTAFGDWRGQDDVYIVDLGFDAIGLPQGLRKFRFHTVSATEFTFEVARLNGTQLTSVTVPKDPARSFTCYRTGAGVLPIEPGQGDWDLVVTQYTHQFYEPFLPYIVSGVLSAPGVRVAEMNVTDFDAVTLADTLAHPFNNARDAIGYDWKTFIFESASYEIDPTRVYIVMDAEGYYFKLRFIDFYSEQGQVGCPRFEVVPL
ncbi:MAG TPA: HmuY family protein [Flavobacteriales bacterium]|nr:HmuY family protein [Flavobacteriales bacterium]